MNIRQAVLLKVLVHVMCVAVPLLSRCAMSARATTVFRDEFNRVGSLNGSTPSIGAGSNWVATSGFTTDGTKVSGSFGLSNFTTSAYVPLPVAITSGNIYTLSATMMRGLSTDDSAIMIFGFFDSLPSWNGGPAIDEGHAIAIAPRNNRSSITTMLNGFANGTEYGVADGTNGTTFGVRLYETAPNTWSAVALELSPTNHLIVGQYSPSPISLTNIATIGMISGSLLPPYIDNFTLDVTPLADLNLDATVDAADAAIMFANWGGSGAGDLNLDGVVDAADAGLLFQEWSGDPAHVPEPSTSSLTVILALSAMIRFGRTPRV